jgi:hypothetical protein
LAGPLSVEDRAIIQEPDGSLAAVSQVGARSSVVVGVNTKVGSITAQSSVTLNSNAAVGGNVTTAGSITAQSGVTVAGTETTQANLTPFATEVWPVEQPDNPANPIDYEPGTSGSITPGSYGAVAIKSRSTLTLTAGAYGFTSFDLEPQATLVVDDTAGPVRIYVQNTIVYGGAIARKGGGQPALLLAQVGAAPVAINATFTGELVAPSAALTLGPGQTPHAGTFLAQSIDVRPGTVVTHRPYFRLTGKPTWGVASSTGGATGSGSGSIMAGPYGVGGFDGSSNFVGAGPTGVVSVSAGGAANTLVSTPGFGFFPVDPSGGRFAVIGGTTTQVYNVSNPTTPAFSVPARGGPVVLVPGTNLVYVATGTFGLDRFQVVGAQIYAPSGLSATFSTPGLMLERLTSSALVWATRTQLVATTLAGAERWRINLSLVTFEVSANGQTLVGLLNAPGSSTIVHVRLSDGAVIGTTALNGVFWNLAAAPGGRFTAATTQTSLTVFDTGKVSRTVDLPVTWANTVDVSDQGYAAVGGQVAPRQGQLVLVGPPGSGTTVIGGSSEIDAYRPGVQFFPGGQSVLLNSMTGLQAYSVQRTM